MQIIGKFPFKAILAFFILCALIVGCSSDDDNSTGTNETWASIREPTIAFTP